MIKKLITKLFLKKDVQILKIEKDVKFTDKVDYLEVELIREDIKIFTYKDKLSIENCCSEDYDKLKGNINNYNYIIFTKDKVRYLIKREDITYMYFIFDEIQILLRG